ncbi:hypothetical protein Scep_009654 [Stephania cephalantha]|uniref:Uncharacterized protein n=1 Tax=Stephania cephalantha TaxID=152367 RepID=A0AAP0PCP8_9MAGN
MRRCIRARERRRRGGAAGSPEQGAAALKARRQGYVEEFAWRWYVEEEQWFSCGGRISSAEWRKEERRATAIYTSSGSGVEGGGN